MDKIRSDPPKQSYFFMDRRAEFAPLSTDAGTAIRDAKTNHEAWSASHEAWRARNEQALRPEQAKEKVLERFREMVEENWRQLGTLTKLSRMCEAAYNGGVALTIDGVMTVIDLPDPAFPEYDDAPGQFQALYKHLIEVRDAGDTPALTSRMIEVETSVHGAGEDGFWPYDLLDDEVVLADIRRNEDRYEQDDYPNSIKEDEIMMSRIHGRVDFEDDPSVYLIKYSGLYHYLNNALGVDVALLPVNGRLQLMEYLTTVNRSGIERIADAAQLLPEEKRRVFSEAFLATEFGDDFGETILDIVENISPEETEHIFSTINELRRGAEEFSERFSQIDPGLAKSTRLALNQRITDSLVALREIAVKGVLDENVAPHRDNPDYNYGGKFDVKLRSIEEAMRIIDGLKNTFDAISSILDADDMKVSCLNEDRSRFSVYRLVSNDAGNMIVYIRTEGAYGYDEGIEYGNGRGVEASINFKVNPLNPHKLLMPKSKEAVSIRFDREGRRVDEDSDSENRDPTREDGLIAVDISSVMGDPKSLPVQIGRLIAAGNRIRSRERGTKDSLHHNTNFLDQEKYGSAGGFSDLARELIVHFDMLREATRRRKFGKRVFSAAAGDSESLKSVA